MTLFNKGRQTESLHFHLQHASFKISGNVPILYTMKTFKGGGGWGGVKGL